MAGLGDRLAVSGVRSDPVGSGEQSGSEHGDLAE